MQQLQFLHKSFRNQIPSVHKTRLNSILLSSETLTLLGRHIVNDAKVRSNIRKIDRLLGNSILHQECPLFYKTMASLLIPKDSAPRIHVDWSCLSSKHELYLLRAVYL